MPVKTKIAWLSLVAACFGTSASAQLPSVQSLVDQAADWQARGRADLASDTWQKVLRIEPDHPEALSGLGMSEIEAGRWDAAKRYLLRLNQAYPDHPATRRLDEAIAGGKNYKERLAEARRLAQNGKPGAAVERYKSLFGGAKLPGDLALEYYQTLGGTYEGWSEAKKGLESLVKDNRGNTRYALALAQICTYREPARRAGIKMLTGLIDKPEVGKEATEAWRQALIWLDARPKDAGLYDAYLRQHPEDATIQERAAQISRPPAGVGKPAGPVDRQASQRAQGYRALRSGNAAAAEARFERILKDKPNDANALGGMGVVRLQQQRFAEARELLERAVAVPGGRKWDQALATARFWALMDEAQQARRAGASERAEQLLEQAMKISPREEAAHVAMADLLLERGQLKPAEERYRQVLQRSPQNIDAIRGLLGALAQQQRDAEAIDLYEKLTPAQQEQVGSVGALRTKRLRAQAKQAAAKGNYAAARTRLEEAVKLDPDDPWTRLELARIYQRDGEQEKASSLLDALTAGEPAKPEALHARAVLWAENAQWQEGLDTLARIPPSARTQEMNALQRRLQINADVQRATALVRRGQTRAASELLKQIRADPGDPELPMARALEEEIDRIRAPHASNIAGGLSFRRRSGEEGLSRLYNTEVPVQARIATGDKGSITLRAVPVTVDAGNLDLGDIQKARRFGSNSLGLPAGGGSVSQRETGVALGAAYHTGPWRVDIGTTPLSFPVVDAVGGVRWRPTYGRLSMEFDLSRRAVTESVLSYSGTRDTRTGEVWGGVRSLGGRVSAAYDLGEHGIYGSAGYRTLSGKRVASNTQWEAGGGWYWHLWNEPERRLTSGVNLTTYGFSKNLGGFTLGHGGYFSPKTYVALGVPLELVGRRGQLSYQARASVGVQHFKTSDSPFFPNDPDLQSRLQSLAAIDPTLGTAHSGGSRTGIGYGFLGALEYRFAPHWHVGGQLGFDNARGFNQQAGMIFLRYWFEPQIRPIYFPPRPVPPFYVGDPG